ncbi:MAG: response regulator transcription factor [Nocardioides sp.]
MGEAGECVGAEGVVGGGGAVELRGHGEVREAGERVGAEGVVGGGGGVELRGRRELGEPAGSKGNGRRLILIVEDEPLINQSVAHRLLAEGYDVARAWDGPTALRLAEERRPDLVLLDVMLPGLDGLTVCRVLQAERPVPVLMLTARDDEPDILAGLEAGADDYLAKPFGMRELLARVSALLRRVDRAAYLASRPAAVLVVGDLVVDTGARRVSVAGDDVRLTPTEFDLLRALARQPGTVISRDDLLSDVWDWPGASGTRTVDSHVKALRAKIGAHRVRTAHGVGYAVEAGPAPSHAGPDVSGSGTPGPSHAPSSREGDDGRPGR